LPDHTKWDLESGKAWMTALAKQTQKANEKIEGVRTTLKVRGMLEVQKPVK